jgi:hypothetical protein
MPAPENSPQNRRSPVDRGDVGSTAAGFAAGVLFDLFVWSTGGNGHGVSPGESGILFATGALGIKNLAQVLGDYLMSWRAADFEDPEKDSEKDLPADILEEKFETFRDHLVKAAKQPTNESPRHLRPLILVKELEESHELWNKDIITKTQFKQILDSAIQRYVGLAGGLENQSVPPPA